MKDDFDQSDDEDERARRYDDGMETDRLLNPPQSVLDMRWDWEHRHP